jgi:hypothetical protein
MASPLLQLRAVTACAAGTWWPKGGARLEGSVSAGDSILVSTTWASCRCPKSPSPNLSLTNVANANGPATVIQAPVNYGNCVTVYQALSVRIRFRAVT